MLIRVSKITVESANKLRALGYIVALTQVHTKSVQPKKQCRPDLTKTPIKPITVHYKAQHEACQVQHIYRVNR